MIVLDNSEKKILEKIENMKGDIIKFLQELIRIPSEVPPAKYVQISKFVAEKMEEIGIKTQIKRNNVIGEIGVESGTSLILYGHMDTVPTFTGWKKDPYGGEVINDKIYGRGAADDKCCIAGVIFAVKALKELGVNLNGKLILTAVVNEEIGGIQGIEYLLEKGYVKGDACLLGDVYCNYPTGYLGGGFFIRFIINGILKHLEEFPDLPLPNRNKYSGINAINKMIPIMNFLTGLQEELKNIETKFPLHPDLPCKISTINLAIIEGGKSHTTVPDKCVLQCFVNTIPEQDVEILKGRVLDYIEDLKKNDPDLNIDVNIARIFKPHIIDVNSNFAKVVKNVYKSVYGEEREFKLYTPITDAQSFIEKGIETILIGAIRGDSNIHAIDEFVYVNDVINITKIYALTALNYLK